MNFVTPSGFRDVLSDEALVRERVVHAVQQVFAARGYVPIETPTLEVMDVMQACLLYTSWPRSWGRRQARRHDDNGCVTVAGGALRPRLSHASM